MLAEGLAVGVNSYLVSSGVGMEGERGNPRLGGSKSLAQCDFLTGKLET